MQGSKTRYSLSTNYNVSSALRVTLRHKLSRFKLCVERLQQTSLLAQTLDHTHQRTQGADDERHCWVCSANDTQLIVLEAV